MSSILNITSGDIEWQDLTFRIWEQRRGYEQTLAVISDHATLYRTRFTPDKVARAATGADAGKATEEEAAEGRNLKAVLEIFQRFKVDADLHASGGDFAGKIRDSVFEKAKYYRGKEVSPLYY